MPRAVAKQARSTIVMDPKKKATFLHQPAFAVPFKLRWDFPSSSVAGGLGSESSWVDMIRSAPEMFSGARTVLNELLSLYRV